MASPGRDESAHLLEECLPAYRALMATAVFTVMRHSELLGLIWEDIDIAGGSNPHASHLSRAHR